MLTVSHLSRLRHVLLALASAVPLIMSYPNFNQPWCAWVALVPWLLALREMTLRQAFGFSYLVGLVFFLGSIWWLIHVTFVGLLVLCAVLAVFFGLFGWLARQFTSHLSPLTSHLVLVPSAWVSLEYLRSHLFSGFGWNLLGYSQTAVLPVIQLADVTGVWGVSFLLVVVNVTVAHLASEPEMRKSLPTTLLTTGLVLVTWLYGVHRLKQPEPANPVTVAVIQGNIAQAEKWDETKRGEILDRYERLTREAANRNPSLIVWPETAVPGYLGLDAPLTDRIRRLAHALAVPLLVGAPMGRFEGNEGVATNSAALLDRDGLMINRYDKLRLVAFGEFIPFERVFPWLRAALPPIGDFVPGRDYTVFQIRNSEFGIRNSEYPFPIPHSPFKFSVLICFEDIFPELSRRFVQGGATALVVITNDAWFGNTAAAYQHAQASTLRAVELRVPVIRAANTGWSGCIDPSGRWRSSVRDSTGKELFVEGIATCEVPPGASGSLYRVWGDWFAGLCLLVTIGWLCSSALIRGARAP